MLKNHLAILFFTFGLSILACSGNADEVEPKTDPKRITMMTYNIHHGAPENSEEVNLANIAAVIKQSGAQVIALQEVDVNVPRSGNVNQAEKLAELLEMEYYFSKSIDYQGGEYGVAILSAFPLSNKRKFELPMVQAGEKRSVALATVTLPDGKTFEFASTHLDLNVPNRTAQTAFLNDLSKTEKKALFVGGDYNAEPNSAEMTQLKKEFMLSCMNSCPLSFPVRNPTKAIDFVAFNKMANQVFSLVSGVALTGQYASDHLPVIAVYQYE